MDKNEYWSLYDYLGKPAGNQLGQEVFAYYKLKYKKKFKVKEREVTTRYYSGRIILYPLWFLEEYFNQNK